MPMAPLWPKRSVGTTMENIMRDNDGNYCVRINEGVPLLLKDKNGNTVAKVLISREKGWGNRKTNSLLIFPESNSEIRVVEGR